MGDLARSMLLDGFLALRKADPYMARGVQSQAAALAGLDEALETRALGLLTKGKAGPSEVRRVAAVLKLITYLNRVGRYGFDIARAVDHLHGTPEPAAGFEALHPMVVNVESMMDIVLGSLRSGQAPDLVRILDLEDAVDAAHARFFELAVAAMAKDPRTLRVGTQGILVARALERCADNVCKMGEKVHYAVTGERVLLR